MHLEHNNIDTLDTVNITLINNIGADPVAARSEPRALNARTLDRGFESRLKHGCLSSSFYVVLSCVGRGLATNWSLVQGVLPMLKWFREQKKRGGEGPKLDYRS
jgi:hypothetical protein